MNDRNDPFDKLARFLRARAEEGAQVTEGIKQNGLLYELANGAAFYSCAALMKIVKGIEDGVENFEECRKEADDPPSEESANN